MANWICPRCGVYFTSPDPLLDRPAACPECGGDCAPADELQCAREASSPVAPAAQVVAGLFAGLVLGGLFAVLESALLWGLRRAAGSWGWYPLAVLHLLFVTGWLFVNAVSLSRARGRPLSVRIALVLALAATLLALPLSR